MDHLPMSVVKSFMGPPFFYPYICIDELFITNFKNSKVIMNYCKCKYIKAWSDLQYEGKARFNGVTGLNPLVILKRCKRLFLNTNLDAKVS